MNTTSEPTQTTIQLFSGNLRAEMARKQLTSIQVAKAIRIGLRDLNDLWMGLRAPTPLEVERLVSFLQVPRFRLLCNPDKCSCTRGGCSL